MADENKNLVIAGYFNLTPEERAEVKKVIEEYDNSDNLDKSFIELAHIIRGLKNKSLGPVSNISSCPCCGK